MTTYIDFNEDYLPTIIDNKPAAFYFNGGEPHAKITTYEDTDFQIKAIVNSWEDFGLFVMFLNALDQQADIFDSHNDYSIYLPYFPGSRQDRSDGHSPLTIEMYAKMIKSALKTASTIDIYTFDIHSLLGWEIIDNVLAETRNSGGQLFNIEVNQLDGSVFDKDITGIIAADKGGVTRASLFGTTFYEGCEFIKCEKSRVFNSGKIAEYDVPDDIPNGKYLVVDDICDGGATFIALADAIHEKNKNVELQLYVSHGIFARGYHELEQRYSKFYTTDSFPHPFVDLDHPIVVIPVPDPFKSEILIG